MLRAAQGFEDIDVVLSGAIDYIKYLEKENRDEAALLQGVANWLGSSSE